MLILLFARSDDNFEIKSKIQFQLLVLMFPIHSGDG